MTPTMAQISQWAQGIGLGECVGIAYVNQFGYLPRTLNDLVTWGNSTGRRNATTGDWACRADDAQLRGGTQGPGSIPPPGAGTNPLAPIAKALGVSTEVVMIGGLGLLVLLLGKRR